MPELEARMYKINSIERDPDPLDHIELAHEACWISFISRSLTSPASHKEFAQPSAWLLLW